MASQSLLHPRRPVFWAIMALATALGGLSSYFYHNWQSTSALPQTNGTRSAEQKPAFDLGTITTYLVDHRGKATRISDLVGTPTLVFFGFTHCPDVCPATLSNLSLWMEATNSEPLAIQTIMVSVDPERDTPEQLSNYVGYFGNSIAGLTGSESDIAAVKKSLAAYSQKIELEDGDYTVDHTSSVYLFDKRGHFSGTISLGENSDDAKAKILRLRND